MLTKNLAVVTPKFVRITRLILGPDSSGVCHVLAHSGLRAVATIMTHLTAEIRFCFARQRTLIADFSSSSHFVLSLSRRLAIFIFFL
jgi:hypothetical protein